MQISIGKQEKKKEKENRFFSLVVYVSFIPSGGTITKPRNQRKLLIRKCGCAADRWIGKTLRPIWKENLLLQLLQNLWTRSRNMEATNKRLKEDLDQDSRP